MNPRTLFIAMSIALLVASALPLFAENFLQDATLFVAPNEDPACGMVALPGMAVVTIQAKRDYLSGVSYVAADPTVLTSFKDHPNPCSKGTAWATWRWNVTAARTNSDVSAITKGFVVNCNAAGSGTGCA